MCLTRFHLHHRQIASCRKGNPALHRWSVQLVHPRPRRGPRAGDRLPDAEIRVDGRSDGLMRLRERYGRVLSVFRLSRQAEGELSDERADALARLALEAMRNTSYDRTATSRSDVRTPDSRRSSSAFYTSTAVAHVQLRPLGGHCRGPGTTSPLSNAYPSLYFAVITSLEFMSMVMVHPEVPLNSNGTGLGPRR